MQSNIDRLIVGVDVSKHNLDVAFWQGEKSIFLGKFTNNYDGFQNVVQNVVKHIQKQISEINVQPHSVFVVMNNLLLSLPSVMDGKSVFLIHSNSEIGSKENESRQTVKMPSCLLCSAESTYVESVARGS